MMRSPRRFRFGRFRSRQSPPGPPRPGLRAAAELAAPRGRAPGCGRSRADVHALQAAPRARGGPPAVRAAGELAVGIEDFRSTAGLGLRTETPAVSEIRHGSTTRQCRIMMAAVHRDAHVRTRLGHPDPPRGIGRSAGLETAEALVAIPVRDWLSPASIAPSSGGSMRSSPPGRRCDRGLFQRPFAGFLPPVDSIASTSPPAGPDRAFGVPPVKRVCGPRDRRSFRRSRREGSRLTRPCQGPVDA